ASDGADEIRPSADGRSLQAVWRKWAQVGAKSGELVDAGLVSDVRWTLRDRMLERVETLTARAPITVRAWRLIVPTTAPVAAPAGDTVTLVGEGTHIRVSIDTPWHTDARVRATGNDPVGRGARGHIPLLVEYEAHDVRIEPGRPLEWRLT